MNASFTRRGNWSIPCAGRELAARLHVIEGQTVALVGGTPSQPGAVLRVNGRLILWEDSGKVTDLGAI